MATTDYKVGEHVYVTKAVSAHSTEIGDSILITKASPNTGKAFVLFFPDDKEEECKQAAAVLKGAGVGTDYTVGARGPGKELTLARARRATRPRARSTFARRQMRRALSEFHRGATVEISLN